MIPSPSDRSNPALLHRISLDYTHRVYFEDNALVPSCKLIADLLTEDLPPSPTFRPKVCVFIDRGLLDKRPSVQESVVSYFGVHRERVQLVSPPTALPGGEAAKDGEAVLRQILTQIRQDKLCRQSTVVAIGGGAFLDVVGFATSIVHRGIRLIRLPSTVLAQNDAGIGIKNGIDYWGAKNYFGCFQIPTAVINDSTLLETLDDATWRDGTSEALKVALLRDPAFFDWIEQNAAALKQRKLEAMRYLIWRCAKNHLEHIATSGDPFERGSARPLDFGHWAAHHLETLSAHAMSHGFAVGLGIAIDSCYSFKQSWLNSGDLRRILSCLLNLGFPFPVAEGHPLKEMQTISAEAVLGGLAEFQEHLGGELTLSMLAGIGKPIQIHRVNQTDMKACIQVVSGYRSMTMPIARAPSQITLDP